MLIKVIIMEKDGKKNLEKCEILNWLHQRSSKHYQSYYMTSWTIVIESL